MNGFQDRMATLRQEFVRRCPADRAALLTAQAERDWAELERIAHSLAGRAGLFGFAAFGTAARDLEITLSRASSDEQVDVALRTLLAAFPDAPSDPTSR